MSIPSPEIVFDGSEAVYCELSDGKTSLREFCSSVRVSKRMDGLPRAELLHDSATVALPPEPVLPLSPPEPELLPPDPEPEPPPDPDDRPPLPEVLPPLPEDFPPEPPEGPASLAVQPA